MKREEFKARVTMAFQGIPSLDDFLEEAWQVHNEEVSQLGWHPASELPPVDEFGESKYLIAYDLDGYAFPAFYSSKRGWMDEDGRDNLVIKWWCYPPKEE